MQITGQVVFEDLEGGVWGIQSAEGRVYRPVDGLPEDFQEIGRSVEAEVEPANVMSMFMWGRAVRLVSIRNAETG